MSRMSPVVAAYCQTHHRSSHTYVVLRWLGFSRTRGYAGAWPHWSNDAADAADAGERGERPLKDN